MQSSLRCAPVLGLGLGIDVHSRTPDWRALLDHAPVAFDFLEVYTRGEPAAAADVVEEVRARGLALPLVYHHENLDPAYPCLAGDETVAAAEANVRALGAPWCVEELAYRHVDGRYLDFFMPALLTRESARTIANNLLALADRIGCPLVPENPPYAFALGDLHVLELLADIARQADAGVVLDLGHLYSYQLVAGLAPLAGIEHLDPASVVEVHVAGAEIVDVDGLLIYHDVHGAGDIAPQVLTMLADLAPRLPHLKAVTIEVEDASNATTLAQAEEVSAIPGVAALRARARGQAR